MTETGADFLTDPTSVERVARLLEDRPVPAVLGIAADERSDLVAWQSQPAESTVMPVAVVMDGATYAAGGSRTRPALAWPMPSHRRWSSGTSNGGGFPEPPERTPSTPVPRLHRSRSVPTRRRVVRQTSNGPRRWPTMGRTEGTGVGSRSVPLVDGAAVLSGIGPPSNPGSARTRATGSGRWSTGPGEGVLTQSQRLDLLAWNDGSSLLEPVDDRGLLPRGSRRPPAQPEPLSAGSGSVHFPAPCACTRMSTSGPIRSAIGSARGSPGGGRRFLWVTSRLCPSDMTSLREAITTAQSGIEISGLKRLKVDVEVAGDFIEQMSGVTETGWAPGGAVALKGSSGASPRRWPLFELALDSGKSSVRHPSRRVRVAARHRAQFRPRPWRRSSGTRDPRAGPPSMRFAIGGPEVSVTSAGRPSLRRVRTFSIRSVFSASSTRYPARLCRSSAFGPRGAVSRRQESRATVWRWTGCRWRTRTTNPRARSASWGRPTGSSPRSTGGRAAGASIGASRSVTAGRTGSHLDAARNGRLAWPPGTRLPGMIDLWEMVSDELVTYSTRPEEFESAGFEARRIVARCGSTAPRAASRSSGWPRAGTGPGSSPPAAGTAVQGFVEQGIVGFLEPGAPPGDPADRSQLTLPDWATFVDVGDARGSAISGVVSAKPMTNGVTLGERGAAGLLSVGPLHLDERVLGHVSLSPVPFGVPDLRGPEPGQRRGPLHQRTIRRRHGRRRGGCGYAWSWSALQAWPECNATPKGPPTLNPMSAGPRRKGEPEPPMEVAKTSLTSRSVDLARRSRCREVSPGPCQADHPARGALTTSTDHGTARGARTKEAGPLHRTADDALAGLPSPSSSARCSSPHGASRRRFSARRMKRPTSRTRWLSSTDSSSAVP